VLRLAADKNFNSNIVPAAWFAGNQISTSSGPRTLDSQEPTMPRSSTGPPTRVGCW
jgi:hypothetical protein